MISVSYNLCDTDNNAGEFDLKTLALFINQHNERFLTMSNYPPVVQFLHGNEVHRVPLKFSEIQAKSSRCRIVDDQDFFVSVHFDRFDAYWIHREDQEYILGCMSYGELSCCSGLGSREFLINQVCDDDRLNHECLQILFDIVGWLTND